MKKILFIATAFCASTALAGGPEMVMMPPSPFDGFYLGGFGGLHQSGFDINDTLYEVTGDVLGDDVRLFQTTQTTLAVENGGATSTDAYYGIQGGWGRVFNNRWYAGIVGFAEFGNGSGSITNYLYDNEEDVHAYTYTQNSARIGTDYGVAAKLGVLLSPTTLAYAKLGAAWANIKASVTSQEVNNNEVRTDYSASNSETEAAFLWGFGAEQFIYKGVLSLFAEYTNESFGSVAVSAYSVPVVSQSAYTQLKLTNSVDADVSAFTGGLNIHFGRDWI